MSVNASMVLTSGAWTTCHIYDHRTPILGVHSVPGGLTLTVDERLSAREQVRLAREFADAAARFAAEIEKWADLARVSLVKVA